MANVTRDVLLEVRNLGRAATDFHRDVLARWSVEPLDWAVLESLAANGTARTDVELARRLLMPASALTASLARLRRRGWLACAATDPLQGAQLTDTGGRAFGALLNDARRVEQRLLAVLDAAEMRGLLASLRRLNRTLEDADEATCAAGGSRRARGPMQPRLVACELEAASPNPSP